MKDFIAGGIPVRLALEQDSEFELSIRRLATFPGSLRQGYGTEVMDELCRLADKHEVVIGLEAHPEEQDDPEDDMDLSTLVSFYARFGFDGDVTHGEDSAWMSREPGRKPELRR